MAGFMRQPQVINDPSAAPAPKRADDIELQAQEGDFIMGYPAMQQSGTRVRSLVEQAMLKAKDAGVERVVFDRGGYAYHGRVKALAEAAREAGLKF